MIDDDHIHGTSNKNATSKLHLITASETDSGIHAMSSSAFPSALRSSPIGSRLSSGSFDETKPFQEASSSPSPISPFDEIFDADGADVDNEGRRRTAASEIPKTASWQTAGLLMIADVVGAGVMSLATAFAQLGWVLSIASLIFWYAVNMYVGMLIAESREAWPRAESFQELAMYTFGARTRLWTGLAVYTFLAFVLGDYVLILGESLQMIFYETRQCSLVWTAIGVLLLLPLSQIRLLALTNWLMIVNVGTIIGSIAFALGTLANEQSRISTTNSTALPYTEAFAADLTLLSFFRSQALFAFAYMGVFIYLEIISEMRDPKEFRYSLLWLSGPFQFLVYLITGGLGYYLIGNTAQGLLIKQIPKGIAYRLAAVLLSVHMVLTFLVKGTILSRAVHGVVSPVTSRQFFSRKAHRIYFLISVAILLFCFIVANLIPFFDDLTSFLGALQTPFIGFILPILFVLKARKKMSFRKTRTSSDVDSDAGLVKTTTGTAEGFFMIVIVGSMILLFFIGVTGSVIIIVDKWTTYGTPFKDC